MSRTLYLFAEAQVLATLGWTGLSLLRPDREGHPEGVAIGFRRDRAGRLNEPLAYRREGWAFDPWIQPAAAGADRPLRIQVELVDDPSALAAAIGWWPNLLEARQNGGVQRDATTTIDGLIVVLRFNPTPEQRAFIASSAIDRAIYLIGPHHRATPGREVGDVADTWSIEVQRLVVALQAGQPPAGGSPGLFAWNSVEIELGSMEVGSAAGEIHHLGAIIGRLLRPDGRAWDRKDLQMSSVGSPPPVDPQGLPTLPSAFEDWPVVPGEPGFIRERVRLDSGAWVEARGRTGRAYRLDQDEGSIAKVVGGFGTDDGEAARAFGGVRGADGLAVLRGIAGAPIRAGSDASVADDMKRLEDNWNLLLARVQEAREHENELSGCADELTAARTHLPAFLWRLFVAGSVTLFVGGVVAFSFGRIGNLVGSSQAWISLICVAAAVGSLVGAFGVWWGEMRAGTRAIHWINRRVKAQEARIRGAYEAAAKIVVGGGEWWRTWRFHGNVRSIRLSAKRIDSVIGEVCRLEADSGRGGVGAPGTGRHRARTTVRIKGRIRSPDPATHSKLITDLSQFDSLKGPASKTGAVISGEFAAELRQRVQEYRAKTVAEGRGEWEPDPNELSAGLQGAESVVAGQERTDRPGLSVVTLENLGGDPVGERMILAGVDVLTRAIGRHADGNGGELLRDAQPHAMPPSCRADAIFVRIVPIHLGEDRSGWSEGVDVRLRGADS